MTWTFSTSMANSTIDFPSQFPVLQECAASSAQRHGLSLEAKPDSLLQRTITLRVAKDAAVGHTTYGSIRNIVLSGFDDGHLVSCGGKAPFPPPDIQ